MRCIEDNFAKYQTRFEKQSLPSDHSEAKEKDLTWEIRESLMEALKQLQRDVQSIEIDNIEVED